MRSVDADDAGLRLELFSHVTQAGPRRPSGEDYILRARLTHYVSGSSNERQAEADQAGFDPTATRGGG
jgi:hypothetical protein